MKEDSTMQSGFDLKSITRENVRKLKPYSSARDEYTDSGADMVFLDANENPFNNGLNRYPDPQQRILKQKLSGIKGIHSSSILLGNGSDEVLDLIFRAFCEPHEDNVITAPPTYGMYKVLAGINAVENREVYLTEEFSLDVDAMLSAADERSKVVFISSPNNPTANRFDDAVITRLLENFRGLVVIDEAYIDFSSKGSWIQKLSDYGNLIVTQTFSKALGMAGIRLGIAYASKEIVGILNKIKPPYNVNELTQLRAMEQLENAEQNASQLVQILEERNRLMAALPDIPCIRQVFDSDANFILARVDDAQNRYDALIARGIVVRNRSSQPLCENTLRFTVGTPKENARLIQVLKEL